MKAFLDALDVWEFIEDNFTESSTKKDTQIYKETTK